MVDFGIALPNDIRITGSANNGFILTCGCCTCVFTDKAKMVEAILEYIDDPKKMEAKYNSAMKFARPLAVETSRDGVGMGGGNTLAAHLEVRSPMNEPDPCCQEDCGPEERRRG